MDIPGYKGNLAWLPARTILLTRHGSHAYGTSTPESDLDLKGVAIPPREYLLGFSQRFDQAEIKDPDVVVYELRKFLALAADANPNILEVLFTDRSDHLGVSPSGEKLLAARGAFLSRKARHTFSGFAMAQLKRLQQHHRWVRSPPAGPPSRADLGLPDEDPAQAEVLRTLLGELEKEVQSYTVELGSLDGATQESLREELRGSLARRLAAEASPWPSAARSLGFDAHAVERLTREREHRARVREWEQYLTWKKTRNARRAELEARHGYDTKFAAHVVRLLRMARELLETGEVRVKRPDRDELLAVRAGAWTFEGLVAWAQEADRALDALEKTSALPRAPDRQALDRLCMTLLEDALGDRL